MNDKSITECYFSNPTKEKVLVKSVIDVYNNNENSLNNNPQKNEKWEGTHSLNENFRAQAQNLVNHNDKLTGFKVYKQTHFNSNKFFTNKEADCESFMLHDNFSNLGYSDFTKTHFNQDCFTHIENICDEKPPFEKDDSMSFNDYSLSRESQDVCNLISENSFLDSKEAPQCLDNDNFKPKISSWDDKSHPISYLACNFEENENSSKMPTISKHIANNDCPSKKENFEKVFSNISSSLFHGEFKPLGAISQSSSKSLQNIANLVLNNDNTLEQSEYFPSLKKNSQNKPMIDKSNNFECQKGLDERAKICFKSLPSSQNSLNKAKSISLHSLQGIKKVDYSHIQSKVKLYIENLKQNNAIRKTKVTQSVPTTPIKSREKLEDVSTIQLDYQLLKNISSQKYINVCDQPENSKILDSILGYDSNGGIQSKILLEALFQQVKNERSQRFEQDLTLNKLQVDYNNLLAKYAQAENVIDKMRTQQGNKTIKNPYNSIKNINNLNGIFSSAGFINQYQEASRNRPNITKSLSTSNIYHDCSHKSESLKEGKLMKYSSSSIIDPDVSITIQMQGLSDQSNIFIDRANDKSLHSDISRSSAYTLNISCSEDEEFVNSGEIWTKKCDSLTQKLREYTMLEGNSALGPLERSSIWNYLTKLYKELFDDAKYFSTSASQKQKLQYLLEAIEYLSLKYKLPIPKIDYVPNRNDEFTSANSVPTITDLIASNSKISTSAQRRNSFDCSILKPTEKELVKDIQDEELNLKLAKEAPTESCLKSISLHQQALSTSNSHSCRTSCGTNLPENVNSDKLSENVNSDKLSENVNSDKLSENVNSDKLSVLHSFLIKSANKTRPNLINNCAQNIVKDIDSGCPLSDRSTKNSPCLSLCLNHTSGLMEDLVLSESTNSPLSETEDFSNCVYSLNKENEWNVSKGAKCFSSTPYKPVERPIEAGFDTSSSSDEKPCYAHNVRYLKKKALKHSKNKFKSQDSIKKYEDKYVSGHRTSVSDYASESPHTHRSCNKNNLSPICQLQKNSPILIAQIDSLRIKRNQHGCKGQIVSKYSQVNSPLKPIKPTCDNYSEKFKVDEASKKIKKTEKNLSEEDVEVRSRKITDSKVNSIATKDLVQNKIVFPAQDVSTSSHGGKLFYPKNSNLPSKMITSTDRPRSISKNKKSDIKYGNLNQRSKSVSSLAQPIVYIEHFNCCNNDCISKNHTKVPDCPIQMSSHLSRNSLSNLHKLNTMSILSSLNEATSLAETLKRRSLSLLDHVRRDTPLTNKGNY